MTQNNPSQQHKTLKNDVNKFWIVWLLGGAVCMLIIVLLIGVLFIGLNKEPKSQVETLVVVPPVVDNTSVENDPSAEVKPVIEPMPSVEVKPKEEKAIPNKEPSLLIAPFSKQQAEEKQATWAKHLGRKVVETNSIGIKLILIPAGEFMMGSGKTVKEIRTQFPSKKKTQEYNYTKEHPQHRVRITKPFYLATKEVTQKQWESVMGTTPWKGNRHIKAGDDHPAANINFNDAQEFIKKLNQLEGIEYRLPTEAEWEYSCRAGTTTVFYFGRSSNGRLSNVRGSYPYGTSTRGTSFGSSTPVGSYPKNNFGLYDMIGNIREWCSDLYDEGYYKQFKNKTAVDPQCLSSESISRVLRGGAWNDFAKYPRSASRLGNPPTLRNHSYGFRLVRMLKTSNRIIIAKPTPKNQPKLKKDKKTNPKPKPIGKQPSLLIAPFSKRAAQTKQRSWARHLQITKTITNSIDMKLTLIPAGQFVMGSPKAEEPDRSDQEVQHKVKITKPFYIATKEVTQKQWEAVMDYIPWKGHSRIRVGDDHPAANINFIDAQEFIKKLNQLEGIEYRLPTEAEWEYSCRAGTTTVFYFGTSSNGRLSNVRGSYPYGTSTRGTYLGSSTPVGSYPKNNFGLYDMIGNIREWCSDLYDEGYYKQFKYKTAIDPQCLSSDSIFRVLRGGSWIDIAKYPRSAYRLGKPPTLRDYSYGFRLVRNP